MITNKHITKAVEAIKEWEKTNEKIVIGIDGYSGVGKTTLLEGIAKENNHILFVTRDDFISPKFAEIYKNTKDRPKAIRYDVIDIEELKDFIKKYKESDEVFEHHLFNGKTGEKDVLKKFDFSKKIMLIEGIFLFHPKQIDDLFDKRIFLNANQEKADGRRRKREMERWGDDYFPDTHPDSIFRLTKIAFNDYLEKYHPEKRADLVLDIN